MTIRVTLHGADDSLQTQLRSAAVVGCVSDAADSDPDLVITVGEEPLSDCAGREERPILPVGVDADWSPAREALIDVLEGLADRELPTVEAAPLIVSVGDWESMAVFDTTLITSEPARISEYEVAVNGHRDAFRADGVVVASPLGSQGYARAAGGPKLDFGTGLAVVPIAPFATIADSWVLEPPLSVTVERDDPVTVFADATELASGRSGLTAEISTGQPLRLIDYRQLPKSP